MVAVALFVDLGLQVGAQGVAQTADILGAGDAVHVVLVDLRMGGHHRLVLHLVCAGRFLGGLGLIGGDGAYTVVLVLLGGHEDLVLLAVLSVDVPAVQLGDAAILAVHGAPEGVGGQRGGVQLGRAQGQVGDAVGWVIEVDEVAPADIGRGEDLVKGGGLVDVRVLRGLAPVQGDFQRAVGREGGVDGRHLRRPGQGNPRKGGRHRYQCRYHQAQGGNAQLLLQVGELCMIQCNAPRSVSSHDTNPSSPAVFLCRASARGCRAGPCAQP